MADSSNSPTRICVFCSTTTGHAPSHLAAARSLAQALHAHGISLIYGGGTTGMMGELAKTLVQLSGPDAVQGYIPREIISVERPGESINEKGSGTDEGVMPGWIKRFVKMEQFKTSAQRESSDQNRSSLLSEEIYGRITESKDMAERKKMMAKAVSTGGTGSGFIGLSGGFGTMDELMEMATWRQFGVHKRGVCLYNVEGYWDDLIKWMETALEAGFVREAAKTILTSKNSAEGCIEWLRDPTIDGGPTLGP